VDFQVTVTYCFTPEHKGIEPHYTSPPQRNEEFAEFCALMTRRYAAGVESPLWHESKRSTVPAE
jgi:beta-xylosidase